MVLHGDRHRGALGRKERGVIDGSGEQQFG
jgi:hypothetical protein